MFHSNIDVVYLLEHVDEHVLFERRRKRPIDLQKIKTLEKTQVESFQVQMDLVIGKGDNERRLGADDIRGPCRYSLR